MTGACLPADGGEEQETEIISRVTLTLTPANGGDQVTVMFDDPDGDGGVSGMAEALLLPAGATFDLTVALLNGLTDPPEDITREVEAEAEEHQILISGDAVRGPASSAADPLIEHTYADRESDYADDSVGEDLPVGIRNSVTTLGPGSGELRVVLRHLPPLAGRPQKSAQVAELAAMGQPPPGEVDVDVTFELTVQ